MSAAAVFCDIERAFDTSLIKLIASFLTNRNFKVSLEEKLSVTREITTEVPQGSIFVYINDAPLASGVHLAHFADLTCIYAIEKHERRTSCFQKIAAWPRCHRVVV
jgi:hypothetical protein